MTRARFTPAARRDLSQIWDYTADSWGLRQAEAYVGEIRTAVESLADNPQMGRTCDEVRQGYRRFRVGSHLLFFRETPEGEGLVIVRILHQRMDPARHL